MRDIIPVEGGKVNQVDPRTEDPPLEAPLALTWRHNPAFSIFSASRAVPILTPFV